MPIAKLIKPVKVNNVTTSIKEFGDGDSFTLKGDGSSETAELVLNNPANTFSTKLKGANVTSNITFTLPDNDGASGQLLRTDGSGNLTFVNDANATELANDSTPQLGGNLDVNSNSIVSVSNGNISVLPDGTGKVLVDGDGTTGGISLESGSIDLKNSGSVSNLKLYCESSNSHYSQIQSAPHSSYSGNVTLTLPTTSGNLLTAGEAQELVGGSEDFVATGSISSGDIVGLRSDGTVEVIADTATNYTTSAGTSVVFESGSTNQTSTTFDSNTNKVVIAYKDEGNSSYGTAVVGTVSGTSISFGTPVVFESGSTNQISTTFDSNSNKVVIAYVNSANSGYGTAVVGTVSGTSISFGTSVVFESANTGSTSFIFDSNTNKVVVSYRDASNSGYGTAVVGTVSGTSISFGTPVVFESASIQYNSSTFDSNTNKVVIAYQDGGNGDFGTAIVGTVSGTSISFGTPVVFVSAGIQYISATFDSNTNKVVIAYKDSNTNIGIAIVGTVSGTSISFGSSVTFESNNAVFISASFDSNTNKVVIAYRGGGSTDGWAIIGTVSGTSISFGTPVVFETQNAEWISTTFDSNANKVVIAYRDDYASGAPGAASVFQAEGTVITTNADSWIGIAVENISDTASGKINILGGINENQTGLTINTDYYVNYDGTLTATENAGPTTGTYGKIGRATSSTNLLITSGND
jgi:hypothetical protein